MDEQRLTPKFLTRRIAEHAITAVAHLVFSDAPLKRKAFHIVVLVPSMKDERADDYPSYPNLPIEPQVLYEQSFSKETWPVKFDDIAKCKALQLWHGRNDDRTDVMPHLLFSGDAPFWGGVKREGIVVACSGVQPCFDKMISGMVADMIIALAYNEWKESDDRKNDVDFLT